MSAIGMLGLINGIKDFGSSIYNMFTKKDDAQRQQDMQKELMDYQFGLNTKGMEQQIAAQKEMYEYTGYGSKVRQLKEAGLNPALIYGGGGAGVTGSISAPNVSGASAPNVAQTTANKTAQMGMALQLAKLRSEIEVNESVAEANRSAASTKPSIINQNQAAANLANQQANTEVIKRFGISLENSIKEVSLEVAKGSQEANIQSAISSAEKVANEAKMYAGKAEEALNQGKMSTQMYETEMLQKQADLKNTMSELLVNWSKYKLQQQEASAITTQLTQGWQKLLLENQGQKIEWLSNQLRNIKDLDVAQIDAITKVFSSLLGGVSTLGGAGIIKGTIK